MNDHTTLVAQDDPTDADLFRQLRDGVDAATRERLYASLVDRYSWLVRWAVNRYSGRGEQAEELQQVGYVGLVEAIGRFDPDRGVEFTAFARPTILGEIRRHFRDRRRWIRLPRKIQELKAQLGAATEHLTQVYGRSPTSAELAVHLDVDREEVDQALATDDVFTPLSLDSPLTEGETVTYLDVRDENDTSLDELVESESLWPLIQQLSPRDQRMLLLRFYGNKTQSEIAAELGISQMHVSRLLHSTLATLRSGLAS